MTDDIQGSAGAGAADEARPAPIPPLAAGDPPLAILVDYDGTISQVDVSEQLLDRFFVGDWHADDVQYVSGQIGSRTFFERQMPTFEGSFEEVVAFAESQPHDATFAGLVRRAEEERVPIEIVSDGLGFFIGPALERLGVPHVPVVTANTTFRDGHARMTFPNGHPECFVCGTCKRNRVLAHQAAGRLVAFVGDGESDLYAAAHADLVFAKGTLVGFCEEFGWAYTGWERLSDITAWLDAALGSWRADPSTLAQPARRELLCGPEVWGPGRTNPPANEPIRDRARRIRG